MGFAAAAVLWIECRGRLREIIIGLPIVVLCLYSLPGTWTEPVISPYKSLSQLLRVPGTQVVATRFSPLGTINVVESKTTPLRHAPGLSLNASVEPPEQLGLFINGDGLSAITRYTGNRTHLAHLDYLTSALPYHLLAPGRVLVLGAGGGAGILQALYHDAGRIDAVLVPRAISSEELVCPATLDILAGTDSAFDFVSGGFQPGGGGDGPISVVEFMTSFDKASNDC
jgi:hypothetical protein